MVEKKRKYQAYYTKSDSIVNYMIGLLGLRGGEYILEPCAGDGVFLDGLIGCHSDVFIDALELNLESVENLTFKYGVNNNIKIRYADFLKDTIIDNYRITGGFYDAIIANPPYGAWRNIEERKHLKEKFNGLYTKESYTLFLLQSINVLKDNGRLSFIIPDTWLSVHMHKQIRKYILTQTKIKEISLFPSSFFPGVNFGYANLMIISLEKSSNPQECLDNAFNIYSGFSKVNELGNIDLPNINKTVLCQKLVFDTIDYSFLVHRDESISNCIENNTCTIGDICNCVTGFYSGNDKVFLKVLNKSVRNSKKYEIVDTNLVEYECSQKCIEGLSNGKCYVPIVKGGNTKYLKKDIWFMSWTQANVVHYIADKKARYQNSNYYFQRGIGIPMISSSSITASLIDNRLFDQSIVGVFPKDNGYLYYLLALFNSPTCNTLIRAINSSTNNSSNYIKKIPFIKPSQKELFEITNNIKIILNNLLIGEFDFTALENANNSIIRDIYGF